MKYGAYNPTPAAVTFWQQMVAQKYPNAKTILDSITKQMELQAKAPAAIPKVTANYKDLMPDAQAQVLQKIGVKSQGGQPLVAAGQQAAQPQGQEMPPQGMEGLPQPQGQEGGMNGQPDVQQVIEEALANLSPEEQKAFSQLPDEKKIEIIQGMMQGVDG
jgi:hypothetical protein